MSEATQPTPDDLAEQVRDLFADAREVLPTEQSAADDSDLSDDERIDVRELGGEAAELLETSDPEALLAALGIGGSEGPGSIPAAILAGEPDDVADLRVLLALSRLAPDEEGDGTFDESEGEAMAIIADLLETDTADESAPDSDDAAGTADGDASDGDGEAETEASDEETDADGETGAAESEEGADEESDEITAALQDALTDVQSGLGDAVGMDSAAGDADEGGGDGGIAEAAGDLVDEAGDRIADATSGEDGGGSEKAAEDADDANDDGEDDGLLGVGDEGGMLDSNEDGGTLGGEGSPGDGESVSGYGRTKHSTIPSQDRADMSGVKRYSTMPGR